MARRIRVRRPWDQEQAREWWKTHLPELCAPAAVGVLAERCGLAVAICSLAVQPLVVLTLVWVFQRRRQC